MSPDLHLVTSNDNTRYKEVEDLFSKMHALSRASAPFDLKARKAHLNSLQNLIKTDAEELVAAVFRDFRGRSVRETLLTEIFPILSSLHYTKKNLNRWMRPQTRRTPWYFFPAMNKVLYQPKGVVLIISPWNYPLNLSLIPLIAAVAAGNRIILKPSEATPKTSDVLKKLIGKYFSPEHVSVVSGGIDVAKLLTTLPFDHIFFTGSTRVGRQVMRAASENLVPVTLELGGKSPAIIHEEYDLRKAAERIVIGKLLNSGQTCIAPDYALVPQNQLQTFVGLYEEAVTKFYPKLISNPDYTCIINQSHFDYLENLLEDARQKGAEIVQIDPAQEMAQNRQRKLAPSIITKVTEEMDMMKQEIFGPILPVMPYNTLQDAIDYVANKPRPLALYYFDKNLKRASSVLERTVSGGAAINDTLFQFAQDDLAFGGVGLSGLGAYHAAEGFQTFSHAKSVFYQSPWNFTSILKPPYGKRFDRILKLIMASRA